MISRIPWNNYQNKVGIFVKFISKVFLFEIQNTIDEFTARIQELQHEVNCMKEIERC